MSVNLKDRPAPAAGAAPAPAASVAAEEGGARVRAPRRSAPRRAFALLAAVLVALAALVALPQEASALTVSKCTAKPNADSGSDVLGAKETRITWEVQADDDETVAAITLTFPDGTDFDTEDARITMLSGENLMTRTSIEASFTIDGQSITATFEDEVPAGAYLRLEVYNVVFPRAGGEMQMAGSYELADGTVAEVADMPTIEVTSVTLAEQLSSWLEEQEWVQKWNSNKFLRLFLNPPILVSSFPVVLKGFFMALAIVAVAFPLAIPLGFALSLMRLSKHKLVRGIAALYVNLVRGTPVFLQIYIAYFGLPLAGIDIPSYPLGVIVMALNSGAYLCEVFRAGIQAIDKGQNEAARSLGMSGAQTMLYVIVPQTFRNVLPNLMSEFILLYKDTSLLAAVGVMEIVMYAKTIVANTGSITPYIVAAVFYLVITMPMSRLVTMLENRLRSNGEGSGKKKGRKGRKGAAAIEAEPAPDAFEEQVEAEAAAAEMAVAAGSASAPDGAEAVQVEAMAPDGSDAPGGPDAPEAEGGAADAAVEGGVSDER